MLLPRALACMAAGMGRTPDEPPSLSLSRAHTLLPRARAHTLLPAAAAGWMTCATGLPSTARCSTSTCRSTTTRGASGLPGVARGGGGNERCRASPSPRDAKQASKPGGASPKRAPRPSSASTEAERASEREQERGLCVLLPEQQPETTHARAIKPSGTGGRPHCARESETERAASQCKAERTPRPEPRGGEKGGS